MPLIHVKSLPFAEPRDVRAVLEGLTWDLAGATSVALEHVTATWEFLLEGHHAGGAALHPRHASHPVLVELVAPDFNSPEDVEKMLETVALSIWNRATVQMDNIFISYRGVSSGTVFDKGKVVRW